MCELCILEIEAVDIGRGNFISKKKLSRKNKKIKQ